MSRRTNIELALRHQWYADRGLLDPYQPTQFSHELYTRRAQAEFTPIERQMIRAHLDMLPPTQQETDHA